MHRKMIDKSSTIKIILTPYNLLIGMNLFLILNEFLMYNRSNQSFQTLKLWPKKHKA